MAEISGTVEIRSDKRRGKMTITIHPDSKDLEPRDHHVPQDKHLLVHANDKVEAGDPLCDGPLVPHDILAIKGEDALHIYLINEVQSVYRSQNVGINDKHIEVILSQMLRKVKVETPGDSEMLPGEVADRFKFQAMAMTRRIDRSSYERSRTRRVRRSWPNQSRECAADRRDRCVCCWA